MLFLKYYLFLEHDKIHFKKKKLVTYEVMIFSDISIINQLFQKLTFLALIRYWHFKGLVAYEVIELIFFLFLLSKIWKIHIMVQN